MRGLSQDLAGLGGDSYYYRNSFEFNYYKRLSKNLIGAYKLHGGNINGNYDLGIIIIPKKSPQFNLDRIKNNCTHVATMQEGPHWFFQDYPLEQQIWFFNILSEMDFLFVHNNSDALYFQGLVGKQCKVMRSLMIEDTIKTIPETTGDGVMIGGNFVSWYGGFDSYIVALSLIHI